MRYIETMFSNPDDFNVIIWTIATLGLAAFLNLMGIGESAIVALVIFLFHMFSVTLLLCFGFYKAFSDMPEVPDPDVLNSTMPVLIYNWQHTSPKQGTFL